MSEHTAEKGRAALLWLGLGSLLSAYCFGPLSSLALTEAMGAWDLTLFAQLAYLGGIAVGCLAIRSVFRGQGFLPTPVQGATGYVGATLLCLAGVAAFARPLLDIGVAALLLFVVGLATAAPVLFWYDCLLDVCRTEGRARCILYIAASQLLPVLAIVCASVVQPAVPKVGLIGMAVAAVCRTEGRARCILYIAASQLLPVLAIVCASVVQPAVPKVGLIGMAVAAVMAAGCQVLYARMTERGEDPTATHRRDWESRGADPQTHGQKRGYRLTPFSTALLVCLGVTWGLGCSVSTHTMESGLEGVPWWVLPLTGAVACAIIAGMSVARGGAGIRFGGLIRLSVVAAGAVLAFVPALHDTLPILFYPLCEVVIVFNEVAVMLFSIEVCYERGLRLADVMPVNYGLFAGSACAGAVLFWLLQTFVGGAMAWELAAAASTVAVVSVIPFLPSRTSDAVTFTLDELPENEGYEERAAKKRENLADKFGLNEREREVLEPLMRGLTRQQIAEELGLSPWTIKDRVAKRENLADKFGLNEREREVLEPLMRGLTRQQIAEELGLSPWTIKDRVAAIYEKVGVHSYKELMQALE